MIRILIAVAVLAIPFFVAVPSMGWSFGDIPRSANDESGLTFDRITDVGIIQGFPDNTFRGNRAFTRYEAAAALSRMVDALLNGKSGSDPLVAEVKDAVATGSTMMSFTDVPRSHWAYDDVEKLENLGIVIGHPGARFDGNRSVTRIEFGVMVSRLAQQLNITQPREHGLELSIDLPSNHWAFHDLEWLLAEGYADGNHGTYFRGDRSFTRYEMAMVLSRMWDRFTELIEPETF